MKDTEILQLKNKFDFSQNKITELREEVERLKKESQDGGREVVKMLRSKNEEYQRTVKI